MPSDTTNFTGRPQLRGPQGPQALQVQATQMQHVAAAPAPDADVAGLINGLAAIHPGLQQYVQRSQALADHSEQLNAQDTALKVTTAHEDPAAALRGGEVQDIPGQSPAWNETYKATALASLASRVGSKNKLDLLSAYADQKNTPDFDANKLIEENRVAALAGVTDGKTAAYIQAHFEDAANSILVDQSRIRVQQREAAQAANLQHNISEGVQPHMTVDQIRAGADRAIQEGLGYGLQPADVAHKILTRLDQLSQLGEGNPEVLQAMSAPGADGKSLLDHAPELTNAVQAAEKQARSIREKAITQRADRGNAMTMDALNAKLESEGGPAWILQHKDEIYGQHVGPYGVWKTHEGYNAFIHSAMKKLQDGSDMNNDMALLLKGQGFAVPTSGRQTAAMNKLLEAHRDQFLSAVSSGDPAAINAVGRTMLGLQSQWQVNQPVDLLKNYFGTVVTSLPTDKGPDKTFVSAAAMYKALEGNPQYRDMHIPEKLAVVLDSYNKEVAAGGDPVASYKNAFKAGNPDAGTTLTREERDKFLKEATSFVSAQDKWLPKLFGGVKANVTREVTDFATKEYMRLAELYPNQTAERLQQSALNSVAQNYTVIPSTGQPVWVPPSVDKKEASEYLGALVKAGMEGGNLKKLPGDYSISVDSDKKGGYTLTMLDGNLHPVRSLRSFQLAPELQVSRQSKNMSPEETKALGGAVLALRTGKDATLDPAVLAKARSTNSISSDDYNGLLKQSATRINRMLKEAPDMGFGKPTADFLGAIPSKGKVDNKLTAYIARMSYSDTSVNGSRGATASGTLGMAMSLIAMGEGAVGTVYQDPNKEAGLDIACGYNLKANAANLEKDFKAAGIPLEHIEDIKAGRRSLTPTQITNLTRTAVNSRMLAVVNYAQKNHPGVWEKMTDPQRAVMIDIQYQTRKGVSEFKNAWAALEAGDTQKFQDSIAVSYRPTDGSPLKLDARRNGLRAALLAGSNYWQSQIGALEKLPSSKLDSAAILTNGK